MAFTLLTQNQAQITAQNDANIYRMLSMGEDLTFIENIKLEFSASQVGIKEGYYLVCGRLIKAENTIISIPSTKGVYRLCLRVQPSASAIADRVKLIILDSTQSRSTTDINGDTASGIYDALLADFDTVTMRFTQRIRYAGVPLIDRVPTATKNSKGTVIAGQNLSINNQGVLNVEIPKAKASTLGGVKVGNGLSITDDGTLSANVQEIPPANAFHLGGVKIGANIDFTSDGTISTHAPYSLPTASKTVKGGVKVGNSLRMNDDILNVSYDYGQSTVVKEGTTLKISASSNRFSFINIYNVNNLETIEFTINTSAPIVINRVKNATGVVISENGVLTDEGLYLLKWHVNAPIYCEVVGNGTSAFITFTNAGTMPCKASDTRLGGIKIGDNINVTADGTISTHPPYSLPTASSITKGGVKVGSGLKIDDDGTLNAINNDDYKEAIVTVNGTTLEITVTTNKFTFSSIEYLNTATSIKFMIAAYGSIVVVNDVIANDGAHLALNGVLTDEFKSLIINNKIICCDVAYENNQAVGVIVTNVGTIPCIASDTQIGGIKVGDGLKIDDDGILSADVHEIPVASVTTLGGVKVGENIDVLSDGTISTHAPYELPTASDDVKGGVKIGSGLSMSFEKLNVSPDYGKATVSLSGTILRVIATSKIFSFSASEYANNAETIRFDFLTDTILTVNKVIANDQTIIVEDGVLTNKVKEIIANSGVIRCELIVDGDNKAVVFTNVNCVMPIATRSKVGGVKAGNNIVITPDGTISTYDQYELPTASESCLGGVKIGDNINVLADGTISTHAPYTLPTASDTTLGGIKIDNANFDIQEDGTLSIGFRDINNSDYVSVASENNDSIVGIDCSEVRIIPDEYNIWFALPIDRSKNYAIASVDDSINTDLRYVEVEVGNISEDGQFIPGERLFSSTYTPTKTSNPTTEQSNQGYSSRKYIVCNTANIDSQYTHIFFGGLGGSTIISAFEKDASADTFSILKSNSKEVVDGLWSKELKTVFPPTYATKLYELRDNTARSFINKFTEDTNGKLSYNGEKILPTATASKLGGIRVGSGLSITSGGTLSADELPVASNTTLGGVKSQAGSHIVISDDGTITLAHDFTGKVAYMNRFYKAPSFVVDTADKSYEGIDCVEIQPTETAGVTSTYRIKPNKTYAIAVPNTVVSTDPSEILSVYDSTGVALDFYGTLNSTPTAEQQAQGYLNGKYYKVSIPITNQETEITIDNYTGGEIALFEKDAGATEFTIFERVVAEVYGLYSKEGDEQSGMQTKTYRIRDDVSRSFIEQFTTDSSGNLYYNGKKVVLEN